MLPINFVTEKERWIVRRFAEEFSSRIPNSTISFKPIENALVNIFIYYGLYSPINTPTIGFFTHKEKETKLSKLFEEVSKKVDWCISMCDITSIYLPKNKTTKILVYPGSIYSTKRPKKIIIGIIGRNYPTGRKRYDWLDELKKIKGIDLKVANGQIDYNDMPNFYKSIDYLLIISENEGGPMPVVEAISMGKPVIAPNVGFCWEYPTIHYDGSLSGLKNVLNKLIIPENGWNVATKQMEFTIEKAIEKFQKHNYLKLFNNLLTNHKIH